MTESSIFRPARNRISVMMHWLRFTVCRMSAIMIPMRNSWWTENRSTVSLFLMFRSIQTVMFYLTACRSESWISRILPRLFRLKKSRISILPWGTIPAMSIRLKTVPQITSQWLSATRMRSATAHRISSMRFWSI